MVWERTSPQCMLYRMADVRSGEPPAPREPELDENGVDVAQIRAMLDLTPGERLLVIQNLVDAVAEIRSLNGPRAVR